MIKLINIIKESRMERKKELSRKSHILIERIKKSIKEEFGV